MKGLKDMEFLQIPIEWNSVKLGSEKPFVLEEIRSGLTNSQNKDGGNYKVSRIETISESIIDDSRVLSPDFISRTIHKIFLIHILTSFSHTVKLVLRTHR